MPKALFDIGSVTAIERQLGIGLPSTYKQILLNYPFEIDSSTYWWDLFGDVNRLLEKNEMYREIGFFGQVWPDQYRGIGANGAGNVFPRVGRTIQQGQVQFEAEERARAERRKSKQW